MCEQCENRGKTANIKDGVYIIPNRCEPKWNIIFDVVGVNFCPKCASLEYLKHNNYEEYCRWCGYTRQRLGNF